MNITLCNYSLLPEELFEKILTQVPEHYLSDKTTIIVYNKGTDILFKERGPILHRIKFFLFTLGFYEYSGTDDSHNIIYLFVARHCKEYRNPHVIHSLLLEFHNLYVRNNYKALYKDLDFILDNVNDFWTNHLVLKDRRGQRKKRWNDFYFQSNWNELKSIFGLTEDYSVIANYL